MSKITIRKTYQTDSESSVSPLDLIEFPKKRLIQHKINMKNYDTDSEDSIYCYEESSSDSIDFPKKRILRKLSENDSNSDTCNNKERKTESKKLVNINKELFKLDSNKSEFIMVKNAWKTLSEYKLPNNYKILKSHPGHYVTIGHHSGLLKNAHWLVFDKDTKKEYYLMHCTGDYYTKFSKDDYKDVINPENNCFPTWHYEKVGYILTKSYNNEKGHYYLHQLICQKHQDKKFKTQSVDHINRDKLDNRNTNLRFLTQSQQNQNTVKRERKYNAQNLPEGINQKDMPKYVGYKSERYGPNNIHFRFCFVIEKHPYQNILKTKNIKDEDFPIRWYTTKSMKVDSNEKLQQAIDKRKEYDEQFKLKYKNEYDNWKKISDEDLD